MRYLKVSAKKQEPPAPRVFISYSRKDSAFVRRLFEMLQARQLTAWVDWEGIPRSAEWWGEIQSAIQEAEAFIFVMSADSLGSTVCQEELAHAVKHHKRLILYLGGRAARAPGDAGRGPRVPKWPFYVAYAPDGARTRSPSQSEP